MLSNDARGSFCHARLPNAGLGNKLFVWAKADVFASLNDLPLRVTGWTQLQMAPILHGGDLRLYLNYFRTRHDVGRGRETDLRRSGKVISEPAVSRADIDRQNTIYEFHAVPHWSDYFGDIRPYRDRVRDSLMKLLTPGRAREIARLTPPAICVNVRLGDFRKLKSGEDFRKAGNTRTPQEYFVDMIGRLRKLHGSNLPVEIVSDGSERDLEPILDLGNCYMAKKRSKIADIIAMSQSKVLVLSASSTFGLWAGFIGECAIVHHPEHFHGCIRPRESNERSFEGVLAGEPDQWPIEFTGLLKGIPAVSA